MTYLFLLYNDESQAPELSDDPEERAKALEPWSQYTQALTEAGVMRGGEALHPTSAATTVTAMTGETLFTDGPFAETREQLGGFYLVECDNLDEALKWAAKCPIVHFGRCEVRPIMDFGSQD